MCYLKFLSNLSLSKREKSTQKLMVRYPVYKVSSTPYFLLDPESPLLVSVPFPFPALLGTRVISFLMTCLKHLPLSFPLWLRSYCGCFLSMYPADHQGSQALGSTDILNPCSFPPLSCGLLICKTMWIPVPAFLTKERRGRSGVVVSRTFDTADQHPPPFVQAPVYLKMKTCQRCAVLYLNFCFLFFTFEVYLTSSGNKNNHLNICPLMNLESWPNALLFNR